MTLCPACRAPLHGGPLRHCHACGFTARSPRRIQRAPVPVAAPGFDAAAVQRLLAMDAHFWARGRRRLVRALLRRFPSRGSHAVELGCGTGDLLPLWEERYERVTAVDGHVALLEQAARRSTRAELIEADVAHTPLAGGDADLVVALDVIEHTDPDALLSEARRLCAPDGHLLLSAPAAPSLWSELDVRAGHRCRYDRHRLAMELRRNGFTPSGSTHYQALLFPLVWLARRLGSEPCGPRERDPAPWLDAALGVVDAFEVEALWRLSLPFGSSVFMWAGVRGG